MTDPKSVLTELNEQLPITSALIRRQSQDAGDVIIFSRLFFLKTKKQKFDSGNTFTEHFPREYQSSVDAIKPFEYLREVAHYVEAFGIVLSHYIKEERVCVIIQCLVVQETLCK